MRASVALAAAMVLSLGSVVGGVAATASPTAERADVAANAAPAACPPTRAIGAIRPGMTGIGWTTVRGDLREPFRVRVLGTLRDGIGPGRDLIIIRVADLGGRRVIRAGGGIWSGMSGSPVYIRGRLAGAISYSLADGPSPVGGMTPARYMERLATESVHRGSSGTSSATRERDVVRLAGALNRSVAAEAGRSTRRTTVLRRLAVPVAVSAGVGGRRSFVGRELRRQLGDPRLVSTGAASASSGSQVASPPRPGQNIAGVIARGDVTVAAVGTVTAVCHGRVIGFGHPMTGEGIVALGAARAKAVAIVDGADPYKLADIGRTFGTLDVDRLVGIRAVPRLMPRMLPVTAHVRSRTTGRVRTGRTSVAMAVWMPTVAADHLLVDIQAVEERSGGGTAQLEWTIRGTRLDTDAAWTLHWSDQVSDPSDVAYASALRLYTQLDALVNDPSTEVRLRSVRIEATISRAVTTDRIRRVDVSRDGGPWQSSGPVEVGPGSELRVRISMRPRNGRTYHRTVRLQVPAGVAGEGVLQVLGGASVPGNACDPVDGSCPDTFGGLLDGLRAAPRGDELLVALDLTDGDGRSVRVSSTLRLAHVVQGHRSLGITAD
jgi:hypothetical protein